MCCYQRPACCLLCRPPVARRTFIYGCTLHAVQENLGVMSIGFMLPNPDDAVIWRGPRKNGLIKQ